MADSSDNSSGSSSRIAADNFGKGMGVATKVVDYTSEIARGNYANIAVKAVQDGVMSAITSKAGRETIEKSVKTTLDVVGDAVPVATGLGQRAGLIAGVLTTGAATLWAAGSEAWAGNHGKALTELAAGGAEAFGNIVPSGVVGALGREAVRGAVEMTVGKDHPEWIPDKSGYRTLAEKGVELARSNSPGSGGDDLSYKPIYPRTASFSQTVDGPCFAGKNIPDVSGQFDRARLGYDVGTPQPMARPVADFTAKRPGAPSLEMQS